jgi:PAS domain S-box-containing protein
MGNKSIAWDRKGHFTVRMLELLVWVTSGLVAVAGAVTLTGSLLRIDPLLNGSGGMKTNMAAAVLLAGVALKLLMEPDAHQLARWVGRTCAVILLLVGALTLFEHLSGSDLRIDELLAHEGPAADGTLSPNRIEPPGSLSLILIGAALLALSGRGRHCLWQPLAVATGLLALLPTLNYFYGGQELYGIARFTGIALPTAACVLALSLGLLCARPQEGMMALLTSPGSGGVTVRRLLLPAFLLPVLMGWLRLLGERKGLYGPELGTALFTLAVLMGFLWLVWRSGSHLDGASKAVQDCEEQFTTMADAIPQLAWIAAADGTIRWFNRRWYEYTGVTERQFEGGGGWPTVLDPKAVPEVLDRWRSSILSGAPLNMEFPLRGDDGRFCWFLTCAMPVKDSEGHVVRWFGTHTDIHDKRAAEEALAAARVSAEAAQAESERAGKAKDEFLAALSHELRTPLAPVLASISMLQRDPHLTPGAQEKLEIGRRNIEMEARLIDDLLDVTHVVRGRVDLSKRPVELSEVIRRATEVCMPDIEVRKLHLEVDLGADAPYIIEGDPGRLQQVFWNLIRNAVKFTPPGGRIGVRCRKRGDEQVVTQVNDTGIGIAPEALPHLFQPLEQGNGGLKRPFGGLGLGLAISKAMVEMHGGTIEAISEGTGKGATFSVTLPIMRSKSPFRRTPEPQSTIPASRLRVLLVEDHGDTAEMMKLLLEGQGHEVCSAADLATALNIAAGDGRFDLIVSDLGLPDGTGFELMRGLRESGHKFPGIALSGYGREQDIAASRAAGFAAHLTKPVDFEGLAAAISSVTAVSANHSAGGK